ncbi:hypothetical protein [Brevundimonas sp. R86498]
MADDGNTSPADSAAYQHAEDGSASVPVASTIPFSNLADRGL